jgi:hypothetical protein
MPTTFNGALSLLLSQTDVFSNTPSMTPTKSLIPYAPNTVLWSDGAVETRYFAVPDNGGLTTPDEQIVFAPTGSWTFPAGTLSVKTFQLNTDTRNPNVLQRLETRLLVRDINDAGYGVTYKWRPDDSDADLLTSSLSEAITITNATRTTTQTWYYLSPADCLTCHTRVANYVLGVNSWQFNGNLTYPGTGVTDNQLRSLNQVVLFNLAFDEVSITNFEKLRALTNLTASIEQRVRSYFDVNCFQCHRPDGTGITFDAQYDTRSVSQNITNYPAAVSLLAGGESADIVKSGDVWRSMIWQRMNTTNDSYKMPNLPRVLSDANSVQVLADWINGMPGGPALAPPVITPNGGNYFLTVNAVLTPPDANAALYYTLDGTLPTANSFLYSGAFSLTSNVMVLANAFGANYNHSVAASALFFVQPVQFTTSGFLASGQFQMGFMGDNRQQLCVAGERELVPVAAH